MWYRKQTGTRRGNRLKPVPDAILDPNRCQMQCWTQTSTTHNTGPEPVPDVVTDQAGTRSTRRSNRLKPVPDAVLDLNRYQAQYQSELDLTWDQTQYRTQICTTHNTGPKPVQHAILDPNQYKTWYRTQAGNRSTICGTRPKLVPDEVFNPNRYQTQYRSELDLTRDMMQYQTQTCTRCKTGPKLVQTWYWTETGTRLSYGTATLCVLLLNRFRCVTRRLWTHDLMEAVSGFIRCIFHKAS